MSGSSCATTGSPIVSSGPTTTSLSTVATPGTNSSISLGPSCRSACATGPTGSDQRDSVLISHGILDQLSEICQTQKTASLLHERSVVGEITAVTPLRTQI